MSLRVGLIARAEQRGLGILTAAFYRHMRPDRTLVVDMGPLAGGFVPDFGQYPDATVVPFDGHYMQAEVAGHTLRGTPDDFRWWLAGLDVVYSAETFYDWRLVEWADQLGVATVLHAMPEFYRHATDPFMPRPTQVWNPTCWRMDLLPPGSPVVPVPVEDDVWPLRPAGTDGPLQVVHVAGHRAAGDRNGTLLLLAAAQRCHQPMDITVHCQDANLPVVRPRAGAVRLRMVAGGQPHRTDLYAGGQVLVLPRRYGGLCMPAQEALGAGLALAMPQCPPNPETWPLVGLRGRWDARQPTPSGGVRSFSADPAVMARAMDSLARRPAYLAEMQGRAVEWARAHSWTELAPVYRQRLAEACA